MKVLDSIDIFVKARKGRYGRAAEMDPEKALITWQTGGDEVVELVTPDGLRIRINGDLRGQIIST